MAQVHADPSSPKSLSGQSAEIAQQSRDTTEPVSSRDSPASVKDDATVNVNEDPLDLAKHRREDVSQKQMKKEHPLAKPKHMKVWGKISTC